MFGGVRVDLFYSFMADAAGGFVALDLAGAVKLRTGLDHELTDRNRPGDAARGHDFEPLSIDFAGKPATDQNLGGRDIAFEIALLTNRDFGFRLHVAFDVAVDVQVVTQGEVADQLCPCSNDGRSGTLAVRRMTSTNDSHSTRSSLVNKTS